MIVFECMKNGKRRKRIIAEPDAEEFNIVLKRYKDELESHKCSLFHFQSNNEVITDCDNLFLTS